jgi:hypothetical protein
MKAEGYHLRKISNWSAFILLILMFGITLYSIYALKNDAWRIAPPLYVALIAAGVIFTLGVLGFRDKSTTFAEVRSWLSTILSLIFIVIFFVSLLFGAFFSGSKELLITEHSPDKKHTIDFYSFNAGAMGPFGVRGELRGPLWFTKPVYQEKTMEPIEVVWQSNHEMLINNHKLDLSTGEPLYIR